MSGKAWAALSAAALIATGAAWAFGSPYYTLWQMMSAAQANDSQAMSRHVDYPSLREDLRSKLHARIAAEAARNQSGYGAIGAAIGSAVVGPLVDSMVSPAGIQAMLDANRQWSARSGRAVGPPVNVGADPVLERRGFSKFAVKARPESESALIFRRHGLGWKLSGIELPPPS